MRTCIRILRAKQKIFLILVSLGSFTCSHDWNNPADNKNDQPNSLLTEGLIAYYPFNGNANDESGNGNDGIVNGPALAIDRFGKQNCSYQFTDDKVHPSQIRILAGQSISPGYRLTCSAWYKSTSRALNSPVLEWTSGVRIWLQVQSDWWPEGGTGANLVDNTGAFHIISITDVNDTLWHNLIISYDVVTGLGRLYIDGTNKKVKNFGVFALKTDEDLYLGTREIPYQGISYQFSGRIDDVRIYNRALSESEILALYHEGGWGY